MLHLPEENWEGLLIVSVDDVVFHKGKIFSYSFQAKWSSYVMNDKRKKYEIKG